MKAPNYITPGGMARLREEYDLLVRVERPKTVEVVAWAAGNGDRSENGDYIYGKRRLREIDRRLRFLGKQIEAAQVIDPLTLSGDRVIFGASVSIEDEEGQIKSYTIVGSDESDPRRHRISWKSPLARALLGKREGEETLVRKPGSESWVTITKVCFEAIDI